MQRVLLVDDDASLRRALARTMQRAGFEVEAYDSVESLLAAGSDATGACLVLDIDLPGVGGAEFGRALRAAGSERPTVFITASESDELDRRLARLAPVAVLHKPFDSEELLGALGRAFS